MERSKTAKSIVFEYCQALKLNTPHVKIVRAPHMPGAFIAWVYIDWFDPPLAFYGSDKRKKEAEHRGMEQLVTYMINNNLVSDITGKPPTRHPLSVVPEIRLNEHAARLLAQCLDQLEAVMPEWAGGIATDPGVGKHAPVSGKGKDFPALLQTTTTTTTAAASTATATATATAATAATTPKPGSKGGSAVGDGEEPLLLPEQMKAPEYLTRKLPAFNHRIEILGALARTQAIVVAGGTGTGKTTQVPQYVLEDFKQRHAAQNRVCKIVVAQPRKISAISVAERIAHERGERLGQSVGYQVRLQKVMPTAEHCILLCTTALALKYLDDDDSMQDMTHLVIDEAHERSIESDLLLALAREKMRTNPYFKVIVMSATIQEHLFADYFGGCRIVEIESKMFPVQEHFLEDMQLIPYPDRVGTSSGKAVPDPRQFPTTAGDVDALEGQPDLWCAALHMALQHLASGSVLMFFSGWKEMKGVRDEIQRRPNFRHCRVFCLHSSMSNDEQMQAFRPVPAGERKVVLATNIAETSITIEDVTIVIDSGKEKTKRFDPVSRSFSLMPGWISKTSAVQRIGRAGRVREGLCYRMFTRAQYRHMQEHAQPEISRLPLENLILQVKLLVPHERVRRFIARLIEPPDIGAVEQAVRSLVSMHAIKADGETLTPLGQSMARLPLDAQVGKMLCVATVLGCQAPVVSVAAGLSVKDPFLKMDEAHMPAHMRGGGPPMVSQRKKFGQRFRSDSAALAQAVDLFQSLPDPYGFCRAEHISISSMRQIESIRVQLQDYVRDTSITALRPPAYLQHIAAHVLASSSSSQQQQYKPPHEKQLDALFAIFKACLVSALYPKLARVPRGPAGEPIKTRKATDTMTSQTVLLHPSSTNVKEVLGCDFLVYLEQVETTTKFIRETTCVPNLTVALFAGNELVPLQVHDGGGADQVMFSVDKAPALTMVTSPRDYQLIRRTRTAVEKMLGVLLSPVESVDPAFRSACEQLLDTLSTMLADEDAATAA